MHPKITPRNLLPVPPSSAVDVAIIGGGLAGITAAYFLTKAGKRVVVAEARTIGSGATAKTTAMLTQVVDTSLIDLVSMFGARTAKAVWQSHAQAITLVERIIKRERISCAFSRCPSYMYANSAQEFKTIKREYHTLRKHGFKASLHPSSRALPFRQAGYIKIPGQAKFDAASYIKCLAQVVRRHGGRIVEHTRVKKIVNDNGITLLTNKKKIVAKQIIIATYQPFTNPAPTVFKKGMYTSYVYYMHIPKNLLPEAIYEDAANPYHYFRIDKRAEHDLLIIGGEDHRAELRLSAKSYRALKDYINCTFPGLRYRVVSRWTGPILESIDGLALIGKVKPQQYVATAFSGNGMTYSAIAGKLLCDLVLGKKNTWQKIYDPTRIPTVKQLARKTIDYGEEFINGAMKNIFK